MAGGGGGHVHGVTHRLDPYLCINISISENHSTLRNENLDKNAKCCIQTNLTMNIILLSLWQIRTRLPKTICKWTTAIVKTKIGGCLPYVVF